MICITNINNWTIFAKSSRTKNRFSTSFFLTPSIIFMITFYVIKFNGLPTFTNIYIALTWQDTIRGRQFYKGHVVTTTTVLQKLPPPPPPTAARPVLGRNLADVDRDRIKCSFQIKEHAYYLISFIQTWMNEIRSL